MSSSTSKNTKIIIENVNENDYGMICAKLYESQSSYNNNNNNNHHNNNHHNNNHHHHHHKSTIIRNNQMLKQIVKNHFSKQKPHTGYDANIYQHYHDIVLSTLRSGFTTNDNIVVDDDDDEKMIKNILSTLEEKGYISIHTNLKTTQESYNQLSNFLQQKTKQDSKIRSDTVAFLNMNDFVLCQLQTQFHVLMGMASFLNEYYYCNKNYYNHDKDNSSSSGGDFEPLSPGTKERPLTNPRNIQAAEYGYGEFYVAHSDNLLLSSTNDSTSQNTTRSNYRLYTCILYCNDDWDINKDGGALRIYPNTQDLLDPSDVITKQYEYEDINPNNGKLLIFDSRLVHSVEKVISKDKKRLALTLWMMKPEDSGVVVDIWNEEKGEVDWYRLM